MSLSTNLEQLISPLNDEMLNSLANQGWCYSDALLSQRFVEELLQLGVEYRKKGFFTAAKIGIASKQQNNEIRTDEICWMDPNRCGLEDQLHQELLKIQSQLNLNLYTGINGYEAHWAHYEKGGFYKAHIDESKQNESSKKGERIISFVMYLNKLWKNDDGGELIIEAAISHKIEPLFGRIVFFDSKKTLHSVALSNQDRWSITGWLRRDPSV
jgi:SM-20-related protein